MVSQLNNQKSLITLVIFVITSIALISQVNSLALLVCDFDNTFTCKDGETPISSSGTTFNTGYRNQGAYFDFTNDYLYYPGSGNVIPPEGTVTFWYRPTYTT